MPDMVSFDHDLADIHYNKATGREGFEYHEKTGYDSAVWLVNHCLETGEEMPLCQVHSQNEVGAENIRCLIQNYYKTFKIDKVCHKVHGQN